MDLRLKIWGKTYSMGLGYFILVCMWLSNHSVLCWEHNLRSIGWFSLISHLLSVWSRTSILFYWLRCLLIHTLLIYYPFKLKFEVEYVWLPTLWSSILILIYCIFATLYMWSQKALKLLVDIHKMADILL